MCIVIDTNVLSCVFSPRNRSHIHYVPVYEWVVNGPAVIVYGGSTYLQELRSAHAYLGLISELRKKKRAKIIEAGAVDREQVAVQSLVPVACNDTHLIAIFRASGCRLLCSNDQRADAHIKNRRYYHPGQAVPRIYRNRGHRHLLIPQNIVPLRNAS